MLPIFAKVSHLLADIARLPKWCYIC